MSSRLEINRSGGRIFFRRNPFSNEPTRASGSTKTTVEINFRRICLIFRFTTVPFFFLFVFEQNDLSLSREISSREGFLRRFTAEIVSPEERTVRGNGNYLLRKERSKFEYENGRSRFSRW